MAAPEPEFTDSFAVQSDNYGDFIRLVRQHVIRYCSDRQPAVSQPVLPPEQKIPGLWFHVTLSTTTTTSLLTLAVLIDNLYLIGFKTLAGVWWEFGKDGDTRLVTNSRWLGFSGHYQELVGQRGLETVTLGRAEMAAAVNVLASHGEQAGSGDAYALLMSMLAKLVFMVCEGVRFHTVYVKVDKEFNDASGGVKLTELEGKQVNKWGRISRAVLAWAVHPEAKFSNMEKLGVKDRNDAARIVALVKDETS